MHGVVRRYARAGALADAMLEREQEIRDLLTSVPGMRAYYALRTSDGSVATITICDDQAGTSESTRRAGEWVRQNMSGASVTPPEVTEGKVYFRI